VQKLGGRIGFDFQFDARWKAKQIQQPTTPPWIRRAIGDDYFRRVVVVNFDEGSNPTDHDLTVLHDLPDLKQLTLMNRTGITDDGLRNLSGLRHLEVLALSGTKTEGAGLGHIRYPRRIEGLALDDASVTDEQLVHVENMLNLKWLTLNNTRITDKGLIHLASLKSLADLQICGTAVTDDGLMHIKMLPSLKRVLLDKTQTTASGRATLRKALPNCKVDD
jgi:hypothetical protein